MSSPDILNSKSKRNGYGKNVLEFLLAGKLNSNNYCDLAVENNVADENNVPSQFTQDLLCNQEDARINQRHENKCNNSCTCFGDTSESESMSTDVDTGEIAAIFSVPQSETSQDHMKEEFVGHTTKTTERAKLRGERKQRRPRSRHGADIIVVLLDLSNPPWPNKRWKANTSDYGTVNFHPSTTGFPAKMAQPTSDVVLRAIEERNQCRKAHLFEYGIPRSGKTTFLHRLIKQIMEPNTGGTITHSSSRKHPPGLIFSTGPCGAGKSTLINELRNYSTGTSGGSLDAFDSLRQEVVVNTLKLKNLQTPHDSVTIFVPEFALPPEHGPIDIWMDEVDTISPTIYAFMNTHGTGKNNAGKLIINNFDTILLQDSDIFKYNFVENGLEKLIYLKFFHATSFLQASELQDDTSLDEQDSQLASGYLLPGCDCYHSLVLTADMISRLKTWPEAFASYLLPQLVNVLEHHSILVPLAGAANAAYFMPCVLYDDMYRRHTLMFVSLQEPAFVCSVLQTFLVLFQLVTDLARLVSALCKLIMLSGDVERNPGPTNSSEKAGFGDLVTIPEVDPKWEELGAILKLDRKSLAAIKAKHSSQSRCKREMFRLAVKKGVTWKEVIKGLCDIGLQSIVRNVCSMFGIPLNGFSSLVLSEQLSEDSVETDLATPTTEVKSVSASIEFQTFQSTRGTLAAEATSDPIMLANAVFSKGIITQDDLHELRIISPDKKKAVKLVSLIEETLLEHPYKFDAFTNALRSISGHVALADICSRLYRFNRIAHKMKDYSPDFLDMNYLSAELNNSQLITDTVRIKAAGATNFVDMCSIILAELRSKELAEPYLSLLDSFPNTKEVCATLRELWHKHAEPHPPERRPERSPPNSSPPQPLERRPERSPPNSSPPQPLERSTPISSKPISSEEVSSTGAVTRSPVTSRLQSPDTDSDHYVSADSDVPTITASPDTTTMSGAHSHKNKMRAALKVWDVKQVDSLLSTGAASVEHLFEDQQTALMLAAIEGHKDMVRTLLQHQASVVARDQDGCTALYLAASNGNYEAVKILAEQPLADVNVKNKHGEPLLMKPAKKGFSMVTELLVQHFGAKVDVETNDGETPLYAAIRKGNFDVVKVLLDRNAEFTKQCRKTRRTPLEEALEGDETEIVRLLMKAVSRVNEKSQKLFTCKTRAEVKHLISKGAKVNTRDSTEATPLLVHAQSSSTEVVRELIHQRANVDLQDCHGYSALSVAARNGNVELVQLLVKHGAILDLKESENGYTALMFAIERGHVRIVKDLVLAKANANIRNRDGKSSLDLAREHGNRGILETLNMHPTTSSGSDPFVDILSGYMAGKGARPKKDKSKHTMNSPPTTTRTTVAPKAPYVPEEDSTHVAEVKKYQKRIADLETRIHDLTILGTMDIADESDLTYMERGRLESEFRKLKESKKKAEQYAVEAKQTAQRLSAENFKLREDLSKERHYNELTRKNMMREVELNVERAVGHTKAAVVRTEVFNEEVANRAFLGRKSGSLYKKVKFTAVQIKKLIMEQKVSLNLFHIVFAGLPFSGKTTLVRSLFGNPAKEGTSAIDLYEAIIHRSKLPDTNIWFEGSKLQSEVHSMIAGFAHFFAKEHKLPDLDLKDINGVFGDPEVQANFVTTCSALHEIVVNIDDETKVERMLTGSLSLINVFDVGVNRAVHEFLMAVEGKNKNLLLVNVLNLSQSDREAMVKPVNLADAKFHRGNYGENQINLFKHRSALHHFVSCMQGASLSESASLTPNTLIVGTHADEFRSQSERFAREEEVMGLLKHYSTDMGYQPNAYFPDMVSVDATKVDTAKSDAAKVDAAKSENPVQSALLKLIDDNKEFRVDIPLKYIFLRYVLYCTKKLYMSRKEVIEYAKKCGMEDESEVDKFLEVFRSAASIISSDVTTEFLHDFVILLPVQFLRDLDRFYCIQDETSILLELRETAQYGILSQRALEALWQGSDSTNMPTWDFYASVLKNVVLLMELGEGKYFCPSLRVQYSDVPVRPSSLIISSSSASFSGKQLAFVKYLSEHHKGLLRLNEECPNYDCVEFLSTKGTEEGRVTIRFFHNFIEVFVDPSNISPSHATTLYTILKTDCVAILNDFSEASYAFSVTCPRSSLKPTDCHFVPFDILDDSTQSLYCTTCKLDINGVEGIHWVKAAYQGARRSAVQAGDIIHPTNLLSICGDLSSLGIEEINTLAKRLMDKDFTSISQVPAGEVLFHVLYSWHCKNPTATKKRLAQALQECGFYKQAITLDSKLLSRSRILSDRTDFSSKEITFIAISWTENWDVEELAQVLGVKTIPDGVTDVDKCSSILEEWLAHSEGDKRERLASKFQEAEYPSMAGYISELVVPD